jgi:hypothetical protein
MGALPGARFGSERNECEFFQAAPSEMRFLLPANLAAIEDNDKISKSSN